MCKDWKHYSIGIAALALCAISAPASAHCDFITGGGFILTTGGGTHPLAKATFGIGGGCKHGQPWGHLEYQDHGNGLNVHWLTITGYRIIATTGDEKDPKREGWRQVCGTARTNLYGDVDFRFGAIDNGEPGRDDRFAIVLGQSGTPVYISTIAGEDDTLGGTGQGGGNIQLHKPNRSTDAFFPEDCNI